MRVPVGNPETSRVHKPKPNFLFPGTVQGSFIIVSINEHEHKHEYNEGSGLIKIDYNSSSMLKHLISFIDGWFKCDHDLIVFNLPHLRTNVSITSDLAMSLFDPRRGHILGLSDELLVHVLSLLTASDLISVCQTCTKLSSLARDKHVIRRLDFRRDTRLTAENFKHFLVGSQTCDKIQTLNLNGVYWIQSSLIHSQLLKMKNLTELHVGDIIFTSKQFSSIMQSLPSLTTLSFTWPWPWRQNTELRKPDLDSSYLNLTELRIFLAVGDSYPLEPLSQLLSKCKNLQKLMIFSEVIDGELPDLCPDRYSILTRMSPLRLPRLKLIVMDFPNFTMPELLVREFWTSTFDATTKDKVELIVTPFCSDSTLVSSDFRDGELSLKKLEKFVEDKKLSKLLLYTPTKGDIWRMESCHEVLQDVFQLTADFFRNLKEINFHQREERDILGSKLRHSTFARKLNDVQCFENLEKISLPICGFLNTSKDIKTSFYGFEEAVRAMPVLTQIEIKHCPETHFHENGAEIVNTLAGNAPKLQSLVMSNIGFQINPSESVFSKLFKGCENLRELHISSLQTDSHKLFTSLEKGLKSSRSLAVLKVYQKQFTQYSERLFVVIKDSCKKLEQIVIVDPSNSFTLRKFPVKSVIDLLTSVTTIRFLYLGSGLLTIEDIKSLKSVTKRITKTRPWLIARYQKKIYQRPFYSLDDVTGLLPMEYQRSVGTLDIRAESQWSQSEVASVSVNQYF